MKKILLSMLMLVVFVATASAQQIKFDKVLHNFGTFSEDDATQTCTFNFVNAGDKPLVINQAVASCGCTVPTYTKTPIKPGEKGTVNIKYNGAGKFPGHFKKSITIRTNGSPELTRLYIEGEMTESKK